MTSQKSLPLKPVDQFKDYPRLAYLRDIYNALMDEVITAMAGNLNFTFSLLFNSGSVQIMYPWSTLLRLWSLNMQLTDLVIFGQRFWAWSVHTTMNTASSLRSDACWVWMPIMFWMNATRSEQRHFQLNLGVHTHQDDKPKTCFYRSMLSCLWEMSTNARTESYWVNLMDDCLITRIVSQL